MSVEHAFVFNHKNSSDNFFCVFVGHITQRNFTSAKDGHFGSESSPSVFSVYWIGWVGGWVSWEIFF